MIFVQGSGWSPMLTVQFTSLRSHHREKDPAFARRPADPVTVDGRAGAKPNLPAQQQSMQVTGQNVNF
jgi:hypothetical protein